MSYPNRPAAHPSRSPWTQLRLRLGVLAAAILVPLLLIGNVPVLAAVLPGAIIAVATLDKMGILDGSKTRRGAIAAELVDARDAAEMRRVALAAPVRAIGTHGFGHRT